MNSGASDGESEVSDEESEALNVKSEVSAGELGGPTEDGVMARLLVALDGELMASNK